MTGDDPQVFGAHEEDDVEEPTPMPDVDDAAAHAAWYVDAVVRTLADLDAKDRDRLRTDDGHGLAWHVREARRTAAGLADPDAVLAPLHAALAASA